MLGQNMFRTGDNSQERTLSPSNASELRLLWENSTTGPVEGSLSAVNGTLYLGAWDSKGIYAFNATDGRLDWTAEAGGGWRPGSPAIPGHGVCNQGIPGSGIQQAWAGVTSTPEVWNETLYVGSGNNTLIAMNGSSAAMPLSQRVEWMLDLANFSSGAWQEHYLWASPLIYNGYVYIGEATGCEGPMVGQLLQVDLRTHQLAHIFNATNTTDWGDSIWGSPSVDPQNNVVWVTTGNEYQLNCSTVNPPYARALIALNATNVSDVLGHWQEPTTCADDDFGAGPTLFTATNGTPMVAAANKDGTGYAFYRSSFHGGNTVGGPAWTVPLSTWDEAPAAFDGRSIFFGDDGHVLALHPNGTPSWTASTQGFAQAGLTVADGLIVDAVDWGNYSGSTLEVRNASSGALLFAHDFVGQQVNGEPVVADGRIFCASGPDSLNGTGHVYAFGIPLNATAQATPVSGSTANFSFEGQATGGMPPYLFTWDFDDGSANVTGTAPTHLFPRSGQYNVTMTAEDLAGLRIEVTLGIVASVATGSGAFSRNPVDVQASLWLNATVSEPVRSVSWSGLPLGCASTDSLTLPCAPAAIGSYRPNASATTTTGQTVIIRFPVLVVNGPLIDLPTLEPMRGTVPLVVSVSAGLAGGSPPYTVMWDFGDGGAGSGSVTTHTFTARGTYSVTLTTSDQGGGRLVWASNVTVADPLEANISSTFRQATCLGGSVSNLVELIGSGSGGFPPYTFAWQLPEGGATGPIVNATFDYGANTTVTLVVKDSANSSVTRSSQVSLELPPCPPPGPNSTPASDAGLPVVPIGIVGALVAGAAVVSAVWLRRRRLRGRT